MARRKNKNAVLIALAVCFVFLSITAISTFVAADHDCAGDGCSVCLFSSGIKRIFTLTVSAAVIIAAFICARLFVRAEVAQRSLVSSKTKLNN